MRKLMGLVLGVALLSVVKGQDRNAEAGSVLAARPWLARHVSSGSVRMELRGLYVSGGLLWVSLRVANLSPIDFRGSAVRFSIRDRHTMRRKAVQERVLLPVVIRGIPVLRADSSGVLCYGLLPRIPGKRQELVIEWMERNGDRRLRLGVKAREVLKAKKLE